jgi:hypothetical protein
MVEVTVPVTTTSFFALRCWKKVDCSVVEAMVAGRLALSELWRVSELEAIDALAGAFPA